MSTPSALPPPAPTHSSPIAIPASALAAPVSPRLSSPRSPIVVSHWSSDILDPGVVRRVSPDRIAGFIELVHGAGEVVRGSINDALDDLGDGIAGNKYDEVEGESVAKKGLSELREGYAALKGRRDEFPPSEWETKRSQQTTAIPQRAPVEPHASTSVSHSNRRPSGEFGERARGLLEAFHGAGEALRGTVNYELDSFGDVISRRPSSEANSQSARVPSQVVAQQGVAEWRDGIAALRGCNTRPAHTLPPQGGLVA